MKKVISLVMVAILAIGMMSGCSSHGSPVSQNENTSPKVVESTPAESTPSSEDVPPVEQETVVDLESFWSEDKTVFDFPAYCEARKLKLSQHENLPSIVKIAFNYENNFGGASLDFSTKYYSLVIFYLYDRSAPKVKNQFFSSVCATQEIYEDYFVNASVVPSEMHRYDGDLSLVDICYGGLFVDENTLTMVLGIIEGALAGEENPFLTLPYGNCAISVHTDNGDGTTTVTGLETYNALECPDISTYR